eukprot:1586915-Prymnesium_polylepis.1
MVRSGAGTFPGRQFALLARLESALRRGRPPRHRSRRQIQGDCAQSDHDDGLCGRLGHRLHKRQLPVRECDVDRIPILHRHPKIGAKDEHRLIGVARQRGRLADTARVVRQHARYSCSVAHFDGVRAIANRVHDGRKLVAADCGRPVVSGHRL